MTQTSGAFSSAEKPFFRYDLHTTAVEENGNRYVDVTDLVEGESFRFYEVEYAVACGMNGQRNLDGIVDWAMLELDLQTTTQEVGAIVDKLAELKYIELGEPAPVVVSAPDLVAPAAVVAAGTPAPPLTEPPVEQRAPGLELGESGRSPIGPARPSMPAEAADVELGLAGHSEVSAVKSASKAIDSEFELGGAGNEGVAPVDEVSVDEVSVDEVSGAATELAEPADVELGVELAVAPPSAEPAVDEMAAASQAASPDLSQTFPVDKDEVKEAVRASKVMPAVAEKATEPAVAEKAAEPAVAEKAAEPAVAEKAAEPAVAEKAAEPAKQKVAERKPLARRSASIVLWLILLGTVAGAAYYYYSEYVQEPPATPARTGEPAVTAAAPAAPAPVAASSVMKITEAPTKDALASRAGPIDWVVDHGTEVSEGDIILKLRGFERLERALDRHTQSLSDYQSRLATGQARNSSAGRIAGLEANVARKEQDVATANAKLDEYLVRAPIDGLVEVLVEDRAKITANQAIGKVTGEAGAVAVFTLPEGRSAEVGDEIEIEAIADTELKATCTVVKSAEQEITLSCPTDSGIEADAALQLSGE